jgi:hypothetical protein
MDTAFKEQIRTDLAEVLLNSEEFGRICTWNGAPLQIAEDARSDLQAYQAQGVNKGSKVIYCRDIDLQPPPEVMEQVDIDGEKWYVEDVREPFGYLIITLNRRTA